MSNVHVGLFRVRHLGVAALLCLLMLAGVYTFYDLVVPIQFDVRRAPRVVGAPELFGAVTASLLPAVMTPVFDRREAVSVAAARRVHCVLTMAGALAPVGVLIVWYVAVLVRAEPQELPAVYDFVGNFVALGAVGLAATLLCGQRLGPPVTLAGCYVLAGLQQAWPESLVAREFSTATRWDTNWAVVILMVAGGVWWTYRWGSVPRAAGR